MSERLYEHRVVELRLCSCFGLACQTRALALSKDKRKRSKKEEPEPETEEKIWTTEQQEALIDAKLKVPTTAPNFWAQVRANEK